MTLILRGFPTIALILTAFLNLGQAALQPGDSLTPYEIRNSRTGDQYCQICVFGGRPVKIVAFGKFSDEAFWADLQKLQTLAKTFPKLGVFAQVMDSQDLAAIKQRAAQAGVKFPVVVPVEQSWNKIWKVDGVSRTLYYAQKDNRIVWTTVGLDDVQTVTQRLQADLGK